MMKSGVTRRMTKRLNEQENKSEFPAVIEAYFFNHEIAISQVKEKQQSFYLKDSKGVTYRYFKNNHILQSFVDGDWHDLITSKDQEDISLF